MLRFPLRGHAARALPALVVLCLSLAHSRVQATEPEGPQFREGWVYCSTNLLVDENVDRLLTLAVSDQGGRNPASELVSPHPDPRLADHVLPQ